MRAQLVGEVDLEGVLRPGDVPADWGVLEVFHADPGDRDLRTLQGSLGVLAPPVRGGDDHAAGERSLAGLSEEGVDVRLRQVVLRVVELALDGGELILGAEVRAGLCDVGDDVDAVVAVVVAARPVRSAPHLVVLLVERGVELELADHELLELGALLRGGAGVAERVDHVMHGGHVGVIYFGCTQFCGRWRGSGVACGTQL